MAREWTTPESWAINKALSVDRLNEISTQLTWLYKMLFAKEGTAVTINSGVISVTGNEAFYKVSGESGSADELLTINGGTDGDVIILAYDGEEITVKDADGNLKLGNYGDLVMSQDGNIIMLRYDGSDWTLLATNVSAEGLSTNVETLSGDKTLTDLDDSIQILDPDGSDRTVKLPVAGGENPFFIIINSGSSGNLNVKDNAEETTIAVAPRERIELYTDQTEKFFYKITADMSTIPVGMLGYVFGGYDGSSNLNETDEFDPNLNTWTSKTALPSPTRQDHGAVDIGSYGYLFGGDNSGDLQDNDEYDRAGDIWSSKTSLPSPAREELCASFLPSTDKAHALGGHDGSELQDNDQYDQSGDNWTSKANLPAPARRHFDGEGADDKIYVFGGNDGSPMNDTDEYNPDTWTGKTNLPNALKKVRCFALAGRTKIHVVGGQDTGGDENDNYEYDPDTFTAKMDLPANRKDGAGFKIDTKGYYAGGATPDDEVWEYATDDTWISKQAMSKAKGFFAGAGID